MQNRLRRLQENLLNKISWQINYSHSVRGTNKPTKYPVDSVNIFRVLQIPKVAIRTRLLLTNQYWMIATKNIMFAKLEHKLIDSIFPAVFLYEILLLQFASMA